jgi:hypothetical protein
MDSLLAEARVILALQATKNNKKLSIRAAAKTYNVPRTTLADPCASRPARRDILPNSLKLVELETDAIIQYVLKVCGILSAWIAWCGRYGQPTIVRAHIASGIGRNWAS